MRDSRKVRLVVAVALIGLAALAAGVLAACGSSASAPAVDVQFIPIDQFKVAGYAGKPLIVNYFGSWCGPCNLEAPELASFAKSHPDAQIVGIAVQDSEGDVVDFMSKYGLSYPVALDSDWGQANQNGVTGVPETVFYDAKGKEVDRIIGASTEAQFDLSYAKAQ